jgi:hypothetical protein
VCDISLLSTCPGYNSNSHSFVNSCSPQPLGNNYLATLEMGNELLAHGPAFRSLARRTFGAEFGDALMGLSQAMLARDPSARPSPAQCVAAMMAVVN